jgi:hypothetical protein
VETNIKVLGWLYIVMGALGILAAILLLVMLMGIGVIANERDAMLVLSIVGISIGVLLSIISLPNIIAGAGLLRFKSWARVVALILGFFNLFAFPLGTVLAIYTFVSLLNQDAAVLFQRS